MKEILLNIFLISNDIAIVLLAIIALYFGIVANKNELLTLTEENEKVLILAISACGVLIFIAILSICAIRKRSTVGSTLFGFFMIGVLSLVIFLAVKLSNETET